MRRKIYPQCDKCGLEINPLVYEDCERSYAINGECWCKSCFRAWLRDWADTSLDEVALSIGVDVMEVNR